MMRRSADAEPLPFVVKKRNCCAQFARQILMLPARPATALLPYMIVHARPPLFEVFVSALGCKDLQRPNSPQGPNRFSSPLTSNFFCHIIFFFPHRIEA
jgi:hypothetical protein